MKPIFIIITITAIFTLAIYLKLNQAAENLERQEFL